MMLTGIYHNIMTQSIEGDFIFFQNLADLAQSDQLVIDLCEILFSQGRCGIIEIYFNIIVFCMF